MPPNFTLRRLTFRACNKTIDTTSCIKQIQVASSPILSLSTVGSEDQPLCSIQHISHPTTNSATNPTTSMYTKSTPIVGRNTRFNPQHARTRLQSPTPPVAALQQALYRIDSRCQSSPTQPTKASHQPPATAHPGQPRLKLPTFAP